MTDIGFHLSLETFGEHSTAESAEAEILDLIRQHPAYDRIMEPGVTIGRYQVPPTDSNGNTTRYKAYATIMKSDTSSIGAVLGVATPVDEGSAP